MFLEKQMHQFNNSDFTWLSVVLVFVFQLMKPDIFEFIEKHSLHDAIREKVWLWKINWNWNGYNVIHLSIWKFSIKKQSKLFVSQYFSHASFSLVLV